MNTYSQLRYEIVECELKEGCYDVVEYTYGGTTGKTWHFESYSEAEHEVEIRKEVE